MNGVNAKKTGVMLALGAAALFGGHAAFGAACGAGSDAPVEVTPHEETPAAIEPRIPRSAGGFAPSFAALVEGDPADVEVLADVETCEGCHADAYRMWRSSGHARGRIADEAAASIAVRAAEGEAALGIGRYAAAASQHRSRRRCCPGSGLPAGWTPEVVDSGRARSSVRQGQPET